MSEHSIIRTLAEAQTALAKAEAGLRMARDGLTIAQAARTKAHADWKKLIRVQHKQETDRRRTHADRRRAGATWDNAFPERRRTDPERRNATADFVSFSKAVLERHTAYMARYNAEVAWREAKGKLIAATAEHKNATAALKKLKRRKISS